MTLELKNVVKRVGAETHIHETSLTLASEGFNVLLGATGAGKTTLIKLMAGLEQPTSGEILFNGKFLNQMDRNELAAYRRDNIGFIFQSYNLLPVYTVYENILFPLLLNDLKESDVREKVRSLVDQVGLSPQINKKPTELSGGQCQRVAIARSLIKDPSLVLADEPTANLDAENSYHILELMLKLNRDFKAAFIFCTHDEKVTKYVRREVRLEDGTIEWDKSNQPEGYLA